MPREFFTTLLRSLSLSRFSRLPSSISMVATAIDWHVHNAALPAALYGVDDSKELVRTLAPPMQQAAPTISFVHPCSGVEQQSTATGDRSNPLHLRGRRQRRGGGAIHRCYPLRGRHLRHRRRVCVLGSLLDGQFCTCLSVNPWKPSTHGF
jgi:hypothetical protein